MPLVELLRIVCDGSLSDFVGYTSSAANKGVLAQHGLDAEALEHSMKLLALCSLAAQTTDKQLTFGAIQAALQLEDACEVELWVIEAIGERLIEASIDQLNSSVTIK